MDGMNYDIIVVYLMLNLKNVLIMNRNMLNYSTAGTSMENINAYYCTIIF